jgi:heme exporter protein C
MPRMLARLLDIVILPAMVVSLALAFLYAPDEATMHSVYRIFYFHVPAAAASFLGFALVCASSVLYLRTRRLRYDVIAAAAAEVGVLFCTLGIGMGMLWAKPVWGTFWIPGDIHLMTTAVLLLIYVAYLMLRAAVDDAERRARLAAVVGIFGFAGVPIVYFSIRIVQVGNHPVLKGLDPRMQLTFMVCMTTMLLFFTFVLLRRIRLGDACSAVERLQRDAWAMVDRLEDGAEAPRLVAGAEHPSSALATTESTISAAKAR